MLGEHGITVGELLNVAAERLFQKFPFEGAVVSLYDADTDTLRGAAGFGIFRGSLIRQDQTCQGEPNPFRKITGPWLISPKPHGTPDQASTIDTTWKATSPTNGPCVSSTSGRPAPPPAKLKPLWVGKEFLKSFVGAGERLSAEKLSFDSDVSRRYGLGFLPEEVTGASFDLSDARFGAEKSIRALDIGNMLTTAVDHDPSRPIQWEWMHLIPDVPKKIEQGVFDLIPNAYVKGADTKVEEIWSFPLEHPRANGSGPFVGQLTFNNPLPAVRGDERIRNLVLREGNRERRTLTKLAVDLCRDDSGAVAFGRRLAIGHNADLLLDSVTRLAKILEDEDAERIIRNLGSLPWDENQLLKNVKEQLVRAFVSDRDAIEKLAGAFAIEKKRARDTLRTMAVVSVLLALEIAVAWMTSLWWEL